MYKLCHFQIFTKTVQKIHKQERKIKVRVSDENCNDQFNLSIVYTQLSWFETIKSDLIIKEILAFDET